MRKLSVAAIAAVVILALTIVLPGNGGQASDPPETNPPSFYTPQMPYAEDVESPVPAASAAGEGGVKPLIVNAWNPLPDDFTAGELVTLFDFKDRSFDLARSDIRLDKAVYEAADAMFAAAKQDGIDGIIITSGYRSREKQEELYNNQKDGTAARPGQSEHETGLAMDVTVMGSEGVFDTTPQFAWLYEHCWDYGFILRYPKGKEHITGIPYEPWHYRYVGLPHSQAIRDQKVTLEEYLEKS